MSHDPSIYLPLIQRLPAAEQHRIVERVEGGRSGRLDWLSEIFDLLLAAAPASVTHPIVGNLGVMSDDPGVLWAIAHHYEWPEDVYGGGRRRSRLEAACDRLRAAEVRRIAVALDERGAPGLAARIAA